MIRAEAKQRGEFPRCWEQARRVERVVREAGTTEQKNQQQEAYVTSMQKQW